MSITVNGTNGLTFNDGSAQNTAATGFGFKNRIINGAMGVWQRGTSGFTSSGAYGADRWSVSTGGTISAGAQSSDVPSGFKYSFSLAGTGTPNLVQKIEAMNCTDLVSQSITISFWAKQSAGSGSNSLFVYLAYANAADNFSGITQIGSQVNFTGTSSWAQYTATFTSLPSGAANGLYVAVGSNVSGSSTTLITGVQLEKGSTATSFDYRPYGTELALCQRYYYQFTSGVAFGSYWSSADVFLTAKLPVTMRTNPSTTLPSGTMTNYIDIIGAGTTNPGSFGAYGYQSTENYNFYALAAAGAATGKPGSYVGSFPIKLSAEL